MRGPIEAESPALKPVRIDHQRAQIRSLKSSDLRVPKLWTGCKITSDDVGLGGFGFWWTARSMNISFVMLVRLFNTDGLETNDLVANLGGLAVSVALPVLLFANRSKLEQDQL
jgi:hypothetical protein